jgi:hypothetical protein
MNKNFIKNYNNYLKKFKKNLLKFKLIIFIIIIFNIKYFVLTKIKNNIKIDELNYYLNNFDLLVKKPSNITDNILLEEKKSIINLLSNNRNLTVLNTIFLNKECNFGNCIVFLNKLIFYCEIIKCKNIILNKDFYWFIKNNITISDYNITISVDDYKNYNNSIALIYDSWDLFFSFFKIKPEIRIHYLRNEIILNLPKIVTHEKDLFIHIRSGDIFFSIIHSPYAQPPLCFYNDILTNFKFRSIYLISQDSRSPLIKKLLKLFPIISYSQKTIKEDISLLINAYNIVNSVSSFVNSIIQLNYNLQYLWEYNIYHMHEKIYAYNHEFNKYPHNNYTIFRMEPSFCYINKMYHWKNRKSQIALMLKEKCINEFVVFKSKNYF